MKTAFVLVFAIATVVLAHPSANCPCSGGDVATKTSECVSQCEIRCAERCQQTSRCNCCNCDNDKKETTKQVIATTPTVAPQIDTTTEAPKSIVQTTAVSPVNPGCQDNRDCRTVHEEHCFVEIRGTIAVRYCGCAADQGGSTSSGCGLPVPPQFVNQCRRQFGEGRICVRFSIYSGGLYGVEQTQENHCKENTKTTGGYPVAPTTTTVATSTVPKSAGALSMLLTMVPVIMAALF